MTNKMVSRVLTYKLYRITELWRFKARNEEKVKEDHLAIFKPGLWRTVFFGYGEEWYYFQQQLLVSKMIVKFLS